MITSTANPRIKNLILLGKKAKARKEQGLFIAEGRKMIEEAPKTWIHQLYIAESFHSDLRNRAFLHGRSYEILSDSVCKAASGTQTPQGVLAEIAIPSWNREDILKKEGGCYLLLESIQDPGNLGTMLRAGEAAGVTAVIANGTTVDIYNPKTIRATMGSIYRVPYLVAEDFTGLLSDMKQNGIKLYAAHLKGSIMYDAPDYTAGSGFLIGNEGNGLTETTASLADAAVKIPMEGSVESLNAAVTASILMYEANRQRRKEKSCFAYGQKSGKQTT